LSVRAGLKIQNEQATVAALVTVRCLKQEAIDALQRLPEDASVEEISEELRIMASIRRGRADIAAGRTKTQEDAEYLLESWATAWTF
jgi:hypothetical protein